MSLKIRLARAGTKKRPVYHIVIADSRSPRDGRFIERLGYFNPLLPKDKPERLKLDLDKVKAWLAKGALPTDRVLRFLDQAGVMKREKRNNPTRAIPRKQRKAQAEADKILGRANRAMWTALSELGVMALLVLIGIWVGGERLLVRPIRRLAQAASQIGHVSQISPAKTANGRAMKMGTRIRAATRARPSAPGWRRWRRSPNRSASSAPRPAGWTG